MPEQYIWTFNGDREELVEFLHVRRVIHKRTYANEKSGICDTDRSLEADKKLKK